MRWKIFKKQKIEQNQDYDFNQNNLNKRPNWRDFDYEKPKNNQNFQQNFSYLNQNFTPNFNLQNENFKSENEKISSEKEQILENIDANFQKEGNLSVLTLITTYAVMAIFFLLTIPVVYVRNEIYYISRDISELRTKHDVLLEENRALKNKLEYQKYKNEILDQFSVVISE